jgi:hypothetical protein
MHSPDPPVSLSPHRTPCRAHIRLTSSHPAGGDVLPPDEDLDSAGTGVSDARQAALDRQRELALQKARQRGVGGVTATDGSASSSLSRTLTRAAPTTLSGAPGSSYSAASDPYASSTAGTGMGFGATGSALADALRERERRAYNDSGLGASSSGSGAERELSSKGLAATYDPSLDSAPHSKGSMAATGAGLNASSSLGSPAASGRGGVSMSLGAGAGSGMGSGSGEDAPILPMSMPTSMPASGAGASKRAGDASALLDFSDMRRFLTNPTPKAVGVVQCYIERDRSSLSNRLYPVYSLHLVEGDRFLMASKKRTNNKTSNYLISMDKRDLARESPAFIGKVRANFVGTEFTVFDDGASPETKGTGTSTPSNLRQVRK